MKETNVIRNVARLALGMAISAWLISCGGQGGKPDRQAPADPPAPIAGKILDQISTAQANLASHKLPLRIVSYTQEPDLATEDQTSAVRNELISPNAMVPQFDGMDPSSFSIHTISERMETLQAARQGSHDESQDVVSNLVSMAFPLIHNGQKVLDITWETQGTQFHTKCVYDDNGLVYDHMLSNIVLAKIENAENLLEMTPAVFQTSSTYTKTIHALSLGITWITGGERGHIDVWHNAEITNNIITSHNGTSSYWMTLGTAKAKYKNVWRKNTSAKLAYGWAYTTPTGSFTITWSDPDKKFVVVLNLGSLASGAGGQSSNVLYVP